MLSAYESTFSQSITHKDLMKSLKQSKQRQEVIRYIHKHISNKLSFHITKSLDFRFVYCYHFLILVWFDYFGRVAFILQLNCARVDLKVDREPSFQGSRSTCLERTRVWVARFNQTKHPYHIILTHPTACDVCAFLYRM